MNSVGVRSSDQCYRCFVLLEYHGFLRGVVIGLRNEYCASSAIFDLVFVPKLWAREIGTTRACWFPARVMFLVQMCGDVDSFLPLEYSSYVLESHVRF